MAENENGNIPELNGDDIDKNKNKIVYFMGLMKQSLKDLASQMTDVKDRLETLSMKVDDKIDGISLTYNTLNQKVALSQKETELYKETSEKRFLESEKKATDLDLRTQRDYRRLEKIENILDVDDKATKKSRSTINYIIVIAVFILGILQFWSSCSDKKMLEDFKQTLSTIQEKTK